MSLVLILLISLIFILWILSQHSSKLVRNEMERVDQEVNSDSVITVPETPSRGMQIKEMMQACEL